VKGSRENSPQLAGHPSALRPEFSSPLSYQQKAISVFHAVPIFLLLF